MKQLETPALTRIVKARSSLILDEPFFGVLSTRLKLVEDATCSDMWTDGKYIGYNPSYVSQLMDIELKGLVAHLVLHVAMGHPWRRSWREAKLWDIATDEAINPILLACGMRLPQGSLNSARFKGKCAELIYADLEKERAAQPPAPSNAGSEPESVSDSKGDEGEGGGGAEDNSKDGTPFNDDGSSYEEARAPGEVRPAPADASEAEWEANVKTAGMQAGKLPGELDRLLKSIRPVDSDWKGQLWHLMETSCVPEDSTWTRPNKRWIHQGLYMPARESSRLRCLVFARDTSASIPDEYLTAANSELQAIVDQLKPQSVYVIDCDAKVQNVIELDDQELPECLLKAKGGGGTRFEPVFEWLEEQGIEPTCVVYLTDLEGSFGAQPPEYPVIWAVPEAVQMQRKAPYGDIVDISI